MAITGCVLIELNEEVGLPDTPGKQYGNYDEDGNELGAPSVLNGALIITHYTRSDYEGSGTAAIRYASGRWDVRNLGHCSCYGPWESSDSFFPPDGPYTAEEALKILTRYKGEDDIAVAAAVAAFSGDRIKIKPFLQHKDPEVRLAALRAIGATSGQEG